jgi:hypothetical protein
MKRPSRAMPRHPDSGGGTPLIPRYARDASLRSAGSLCISCVSPERTNGVTPYGGHDHVRVSLTANPDRKRYRSDRKGKIEN